MEAKSKKSIWKKWWFWVIIAVVVLGIAGAATGSEKKTNEKNGGDTSASTDVTPQWKQVAEYSGTSEHGESNVFALSGGDVRIKYNVTAASTGGNAMIYVLKEGETATADAAGNSDIKTADAWPMGTKSGEEIVKKEAGNYFIYVNSSSISDYKITVEEKR